MRRIFPLLFAAWIVTGTVRILPAAPEKEFLTDKEITALQEAQEIDLRIPIYMTAAKLRLSAVEDRLNGKDSPEGDPLEFFTPEEMLDGYYRMVKSVMTNLDAAFKMGLRERDRVESALKSLKGSTESMGKELEILKKLAEQRKKEEVWNLVNQAIEITRGAHEGAEYGLSKLKASPPKK
jgi:hypothetical protein